MKIAEQQHVVKVDGDVKINEFGFIFNGKMVKLLSDNLYKNKIEAIIRELSTNAYDSQVEAGRQQKPFDVHLPSYREPYFSVRDYGTGMSPERVDNIYRFYGASDRTDSNEFTGGMGLGSKVPFCYNTQTFTVDSWCDGIHTCYSCFIGENGKPNIAKMSEAESNEPCGVRIKLQVKSDDYSNFMYAAREVYSVFPVTPNFIGQNCTVSKPKYTLESNDGSWKLRASDGYSCRVIMGNVAYPVDINDANITASQRAVMNSSFDLFVEVGSLSVDIGREGLSYDNRTRTRIGNLLNKVVDDYNKRIKEEIDKCKNLWEARKKFVELYNKAELRVMDGAKLTYNGVQLFDRSGYHTVPLTTFTTHTKDLQGNIISNPTVNIVAISAGGWRSSKSYDKQERINSLSASDGYMFFENDLTIGSFVRAADVARKQLCIVLLFKFTSDKAREEIIEHIGCDDTYFPKISSIPSPTVRATGTSKGSFGRVMLFAQSTNPRTHAVTLFWKPDQKIDFDKDGGLYIEINRFNIRSNSGVLTDPQELSRIVNMAKEAGITVPDIYGIKTADIDRIKHNAKWVNIFTYLSQEIAKALPTLDLAKIEYYNKQISRLGQRSYSYATQGHNKLDMDSCYKLRSMCKTINTFTNFVDAVQVAEKEVKELDKANSMRGLANKLNVAIPKYPAFSAVELDKMEQAAYNKYTMLGFLDYHVCDSQSGIRKIAAYIDSIS